MPVDIAYTTVSNWQLSSQHYEQHGYTRQEQQLQYTTSRDIMTEAADLQQDVVHVRMRLLYLIKQNHTEGLAPDSLCQFASISIAHVTCIPTFDY